MGVEVVPAPASNPAEITAAIDAFARTPNGGLIVLPSAVGTRHRGVIAEGRAAPWPPIDLSTAHVSGERRPDVVWDSAG
jgi:hypothetical protein